MLLCTRVSIGVIAISFIIVGATNGGADDVLKKAVAICTECIGLG
ncbi:MAG: thioredoxin [Clostridiales bacterium]|nr:thioredoxin [Clostridiales bacterium]